MNPLENDSRETLGRYKYNLKFWIIINVVLTFILLVGHVIVLGAMQQIYTRMISIQLSHANYVKKYEEAIGVIKPSSKPVEVVIVKKPHKAE